MNQSYPRPRSIRTIVSEVLLCIKRPTMDNC